MMRTQPHTPGTIMRTHTLTAAVLLLAPLTACSSSGQTDAKPATAAPTISRQDQFLTAVTQAHVDSWATAGPTDTELAAYPERWCAGLAAGHSVAYLLSIDGGLYPIGENWGTAEPDAQRVLLLGVTVYCPEYRDRVTQELRGSGGY